MRCDRGAGSVHIFDPALAETLLATYGYVAIFVLVMLESAGIPLPGETILVSASIYASTSRGLDIRFVIGAAAAGAIVGDNIGFWVGRTFGQRLLTRWGYLIGLDERKLKLGQYLFMRQGGKIVFFGRFVALLRALAAILAGVNGFSPFRFLVLNAAGGIAWATVFGLGGYLFGEGVHRIARPIGWAALALALVAAFILWRFFKRHQEQLLANAEAAASNTSQQRP
jgi:membrane protein DedA with SNARE-associated domain